MTDKIKTANCAHYKDIALVALEHAKKLGADEASVNIGRADGLSINSRKQEIESIEFNNDVGFNITLYFNNKRGNANSTDLNIDAIKQTVNEACSIAKYTSADPFNGLALKDEMAKDIYDLELYHPKELTTDELSDFAILMEHEAFAHDKRITNSDGAHVSSTTSMRILANSHGFLASNKSTLYSAYCSMIAGNGDNMQRNSDYTLSRRFDKLDSPKNVGVKAAQKTVASLNPKKLATCRLPVIFDASIAGKIIRSFTSAISGHALYKKSTFLLDSIETQIFPEWFNIYEDPFKKEGFASGSYDSEGVQARKRSIVKDGIIKSYLLSSYSAKKLNLLNTGHASGTYNLDISSTNQSYDELLKLMDKGIVVTQTMGQGVNQVTGDYSIGVSGFYVENGICLYPVAEITVACNLKDMYKNIIAIGNDFETRSSIHCGSILFASMMIGGS